MSPPLVAAWLCAATCLYATTVHADAKDELRFQQGIASYGAKEFGTAREAFQTFLSRNPEDATALRYLGLISRAEDNDDEAIDFFRRALELEPTDVVTYVALSETLLKASRNVPALEILKTALALAPTNPRLHLYRGIAEYRLRNLNVAVEHFERAAALDPNMEREARYYTGLTQAILGNLYTAAQAFNEVAQTSPAHPLGRSARNLREAMEPETPEQRWNVNATAGVEFDTNPLVIGDVGTADDENDDPESDVAGTFGVRGLVDAYRGPGVTIRAGYDGFFTKHIDIDEIDEQTHIARGVLLYDLRNVRLAMRYDGAFTALEYDDPLRFSSIVEPSMSIRVGRLGITQAFYQLHHAEYFDNPGDADFDLDGFQHAIGATQTILPRHPWTHLRIGAQALFRDTDGDEFDSIGGSVDLGAGALLPWFDIELSGVYRFTYASFLNDSVFECDGTPFDAAVEDPCEREDFTHEISMNMNVPLWERLSLDVTGAFVYQDSNAEYSRYDRFIVGTYLTWDFGEKPKPRRRPMPILEEPERDEGRFPGE